MGGCEYHCQYYYKLLPKVILHHRTPRVMVCEVGPGLRWPLTLILFFVRGSKKVALMFFFFSTISMDSVLRHTTSQDTFSYTKRGPQYPQCRPQAGDKCAPSRRIHAQPLHARAQVEARSDRHRTPLNVCSRHGTRVARGWAPGLSIALECHVSVKSLIIKVSP